MILCYWKTFSVPDHCFPSTHKILSPSQLKYEGSAVQAPPWAAAAILHCKAAAGRDNGLLAPIVSGPLPPYKDWGLADRYVV